jgi:hypothetical protein
MPENVQNPAAQSPSEADRGRVPSEASTSNNPKKSSDWLGGPQNGNETPSEAYGSGSSSGFLSENAKNPKEGLDYAGVDEGNLKNGYGAVDAGGDVQGVDTQTGTQAKGDGYTKHRFNETPGNGGNGGNGDETSVGNAYWQFFSDPTIKAKINTIVDQADIPKTVVGEDLSQAPLREVLSQNSGDQRNWVLTEGWLGLVKGLSQVMNVPPCPTENSPKTLSAWLGDAGLEPWLTSPAQYDEPLGNVIQWPLLGYSFPWFQPA